MRRAALARQPLISSCAHSTLPSTVSYTSGGLRETLITGGLVIRLRRNSCPERISKRRYGHLDPMNLEKGA